MLNAPGKNIRMNKNKRIEGWSKISNGMVMVPIIKVTFGGGGNVWHILATVRSLKYLLQRKLVGR